MLGLGVEQAKEVPWIILSQKELLNSDPALFLCLVCARPWGYNSE